MMQVIEPNAIPSRIARGVYEARVLLDFSIDSIEEVLKNLSKKKSFYYLS